jgi:ribose/xylose/arabinose/galactoside ABC-type transport system permease subunit
VSRYGLLVNPPEEPPAAPRANVVPHLIWEAVLLLGAIAVTVLAISDGHFVDSHNPLWSQLGIVGFVAAGFALSLRAGTPNLAVGSAATLAGVCYVEALRANWATPVAVVAAVLAATGLGLVLAVVVGLTGLPSWAVSLGGMAIVLTISVAAGAGNPVRDGHGPISRELLWAFSVLFVLASIGGGLLWLVPGVRRLRYAQPQPGGAGGGVGSRMLAALVGLGASSLLAGLGGMLNTGYLGGYVSSVSDQTQLLLAAGAVLLGGLSIAGRSYGVAGTVLAVYLLVLTRYEVVLHSSSFWLIYLAPAVAMILGLPVGWLLDRLGNRKATTPGYPAAPGPAVAGPYAFTPEPQQAWPAPQQGWPAPQQTWPAAQQPGPGPQQQQAWPAPPQQQAWPAPQQQAPPG